MHKRHYILSITVGPFDNCQRITVVRQEYDLRESTHEVIGLSCLARIKSNKSFISFTDANDFAKRLEDCGITKSPA